MGKNTYLHRCIRNIISLKNRHKPLPSNHHKIHLSPWVALALCGLFTGAWWLLPHPILIVIAGLAPLAIYGVLRLPFVIVLSFVIFSFCRIHEAFPFLNPLKIPQLLALGSLFALGWHIVVTGKIQPFWDKSLDWVTVFFVLVFIGIFFATSRDIAITAFKDSYIKIIIMTYAIAWLTRTPSDFKLSLYLFTLSGVAVASVALFNKANGIGLVEGTRVTVGRELGSILGDPNDLALVLMFPISFAASLMLNKGLGKIARCIGTLSTITLFSAVIATQSRGGLLGVIAVFGLMAYRRIESKLIFFGGGAVAVMGLFVMAGISGRASGGAAEEGVDASAMGRIYAWQAAWGMALVNPITGVGLKNFFSNYFFYSPHWDGLNHAVHSTWFGVMAESGLLGIIVFVGMVIKLIIDATNSTNFAIQRCAPPVITAASEANLASILGIAVSGTFLTQGYTWPIYVVASLIIAMKHWQKNNL
ncbi:O-antigen ligase family protein [Marinagarivorans algicola]|uniref:O-antigen ligase family protein n=1 Tax=Marinagarivorans algicola TaxID=1513270 RepID=UPI0009E6710F|nr:O-antigen ligase family protein [Marinagarivorans algicola]